MDILCDKRKIHRNLDKLQVLELLLRHEFFSFLYESLTVFFSDVPFSFIFLIVL